MNENVAVTFYYRMPACNSSAERCGCSKFCLYHHSVTFGGVSVGKVHELQLYRCVGEVHYCIIVKFN